MLVCGVDLSGNDAIVSLLKFEKGVFHQPACRTTRISCTNPDSREALVYFQKTFAKLVEDYKGSGHLNTLFSNIAFKCECAK
ncbi:DUF3010 family protein [Thiomicrospira sp. ALE5]|uniref:DUF3010 family protein n=1 Tax=Thiomicrospira sp. ALE5 TaxID=748650 RepID=UPI0008E3149B|nr:DUF3010 family protein [Thiomicrospira sp. ALE5]SFR52923.1 Protein of unknown function [Thiomicrospira sp. ALE5]